MIRLLGFLGAASAAAFLMAPGASAAEDATLSGNPNLACGPDGVDECEGRRQATGTHQPDAEPALVINGTFGRIVVDHHSAGLAPHPMTPTLCRTAEYCRTVFPEPWGDVFGPGDQDTRVDQWHGVQLGVSEGRDGMALNVGAGIGIDPKPDKHGAVPDPDRWSMGVTLRYNQFSAGAVIGEAEATEVNPELQNWSVGANYAEEGLSLAFGYRETRPEDVTLSDGVSQVDMGVGFAIAPGVEVGAAVQWAGRWSETEEETDPDSVNGGLSVKVNF